MDRETLIRELETRRTAGCSAEKISSAQKWSLKRPKKRSKRLALTSGLRTSGSRGEASALRCTRSTPPPDLRERPLLNMQPQYVDSVPPVPDLPSPEQLSTDGGMAAWLEEFQRAQARVVQERVDQHFMQELAGQAQMRMVSDELGSAPSETVSPHNSPSTQRAEEWNTFSIPTTGDTPNEDV